MRTFQAGRTCVAVLAFVLFGSQTLADTDFRGVAGITGSGARASSSGDDVRGITGSGARGITGSGSRGITGSGSRGITGSGSRGITGSGSRGITGSGSRGITGSGSRGITGSGSRGITGSGARGITGSGSRDIGEGLASEYRSAALGPIEMLTQGSGVAVISVAGQVFVTTRDVGELQVGEYVLIAGSGDGDVEVLLRLDEVYVPGASRIWVRGEVNSVSPERGLLTVGSTSFDYTPVLSIAPDYRPQIGDFVEIAGTQYTPKGVVLVSADASLLSSAADVDLAALRLDSTTQGITGSGRR